VLQSSVKTVALAALKVKRLVPVDITLGNPPSTQSVKIIEKNKLLFKLNLHINQIAIKRIIS